ncbi:MAG: hypothetical protein WAO98_06370 [Alphaproteobacteria bacterium]
MVLDPGFPFSPRVAAELRANANALMGVRPPVQLESAEPLLLTPYAGRDTLEADIDLVTSGYSINLLAEITSMAGMTPKALREILNLELAPTRDEATVLAQTLIHFGANPSRTGDDYLKELALPEPLLGGGGGGFEAPSSPRSSVSGRSRPASIIL